MKRLIVAITGASGARYGVRLLELLGATEGIETHLMISDAAALMYTACAISARVSPVGRFELTAW